MGWMSGVVNLALSWRWTFHILGITGPFPIDVCAFTSIDVDFPYTLHSTNELRI